MKTHERLETARLVLRAPEPSDADAIFAYASDPEVTRFLSWPRHTSIDETQAFLAHSAKEWARSPVGPLVIVAHAGGKVIGSTGLGFDTPSHATTGYVLARPHWGNLVFPNFEDLTAQDVRCYARSREDRGRGTRAITARTALDQQP